MEDNKLLDQINRYLSEEDAERFPELSKDAITTLYGLGYYLYENGKYTESKQVFRFLSLIEPFDKRHWIGLGAAYQMLKDFNSALECYSVAAIQDPNNPHIHLYAADCFFAKGDNNMGIKTLESAITVAEKLNSTSLLKQLKYMHQSWNHVDVK